MGIGELLLGIMWFLTPAYVANMMPVFVARLFGKRLDMPADFGLSRYISIAHKLTGWNAVKARVEQLSLDLSDAQIKALTHHVKAMADERTLTLDDVDELLHHWAQTQQLPPSAMASNGKNSTLQQTPDVLETS